MNPQADTLASMMLSIWRAINSLLDAIDVKILVYYYRSNSPSAYRAARELGIGVTTAYRRVRRLVEEKFLLSTNGSQKPSQLGISAKGCIALYVHRVLNLEEFAKCVRRSWRLKCKFCDTTTIVSYVTMLGIVLKKRGIEFDKVDISRLEESSIYLLPLLKESLALHLLEGLTFSESLDVIASKYGVNGKVLRSALRLSLYGLSRLVPLTVTWDKHKVAVMINDRALLHFSLECEGLCPEYERSLGLECPLAREAVVKRIQNIINMGF